MGKNKIILISIVVIVILAGIFGSNSSNDTNNQEQTTQEQTTQEQTTQEQTSPEQVAQEQTMQEQITEVEDTAEINVDNTSDTEDNVINQEHPEQTTLDGVLRAHFIDVGQADCIYIELPNKENMLIDAGNNGDKTTIINYLNSQGINKINYVIGTHPHEDHIGSLDTVIDRYDIGNIYMTKASANTKTFEDVLNSIQSKGLKVKAPESGFYIVDIKNQSDDKVKDELVIQVIAPNSGNYDDVNNISIVVKVTFRNTSMLFMGDAEDVSESEIINAGYDIKSTLLKVGHHGSTSSTTERFIKEVQPKYAIISVGEDNTYGHPAQSTLDRLNKSGIKIYRTDEQGTIVATSDGNTIAIDKNSSPVIRSVTQTVTTKTNNEQEKNVTVYVTKTGKKYHNEGCRSLSKSKIPIDLSEAKSKGYESCKICNP